MAILILAGLMLYLTDLFFDLKNLLNPFVFFYLYQTFFCFIALSYADIYPIEISQELKFLLVSAYILTFAGGLTSRYVFQKAAIPYVKYNELSISSTPSKAFIWAGTSIFFFAVIVFAYFTYKTGGIIILGDEVENARIERRKGAGMINLLFISFFLYGYLVVLLNKRLSKYIKVVLFLVAAFALISFGSRAPMIKLLLASFLLLGVLSRRKYSLSKFFAIGLAVLFLIIILGALRTNLKSGVDFMDVMIARMGWRPFVNVQNLQRILDFFPAKHDFLYGKSYLVEMGVFLPGSNPNFGSYLKEIMKWKFDGGSITPTFLGVGYINFGKTAFFLYPFAFGFLFNTIYQLLCYRSKVSNLSLIFLILFSIGISGSLSTGLMPSLISNILFLLFTVFLHLTIKQLISGNPLRVYWKE
jgi:oligosaccharide repeat unit polymerase